MNFLKNIFLISSAISGLVLIIIFLFSQSEEQDVLANKVGGFMPGSFDAVKNKIIVSLVATFCSSILMISAISYRSKRSISIEKAFQKLSTKSEEKANKKTPQVKDVGNKTGNVDYE